MAAGHFAFASNTNRFLACEPLTGQPFAIAGVPYDGVVTNRPGARFGPQAIRAAREYVADHAELTSHAAATFVWTCLCGQVQRRQRVGA